MHALQKSLALAAVVWLSACGNSLPGAISSKATDVAATPALVDECTAAYADAESKALRSGPVIGLHALDFGKAGTLFLGFANDVDRNAAGARLKSQPLAALTGVRVYRNLPLIAVNTNLVSESLVASLTGLLKGIRVLSIYPDQKLKFHLHDANEYTGAAAAREQYGLSGKGIGVAVIDSGIDELQGDFENVALNIKLVGTATGVAGSVPLTSGVIAVDVTGTNSDTSSGHGTHVAGAVGGTGKMSDGYHTGFAPGATLIGIGTGEALFVSYAAEAYDYILDPVIRDKYNIRVTNNSYGGPEGAGFAPFNPFNLLTKRAHDDGIIPVFSAGNSGSPEDDGSVSNHSDYGASPCVISVASGIANTGYYDVNPLNYLLGGTPPTEYPMPQADRRGQLSSFSSRGLKGDINDHPDITAPGDYLASAYNPQGVVLYAGGGASPYVDPAHPAWSASYYRLSGTSMSSPVVAGIVALLLEANPDATFPQVLDALTSTARPMFDATGRAYEEWEVGAGFVDVKAAVEKIRAIEQPLVTVSETAEYTGSAGPGISVPLVGDLYAAQATQTIELPALPTGARYAKLKLDISWLVPANDLDVVVLGPDGKVVGSSGNPAGSFEYVSLVNPQPGTYTVQINSYLNTPDSYTIKATTVKRVPR